MSSRPYPAPIPPLSHPRPSPQPSRDRTKAPHVAVLGRAAPREARELRGHRFLEALWAEWNPVPNPIPNPNPNPNPNPIPNQALWAEWNPRLRAGRITRRYFKPFGYGASLFALGQEHCPNPNLSPSPRALALALALTPTLILTWGRSIAGPGSACGRGAGRPPSSRHEAPTASRPSRRCTARVTWRPTRPRRGCWPSLHVTAVFVDGERE